MKEILENDPIFGTTTYEYDPIAKTQTISLHADIEPVLEANQKLRNDPDHWKKGVKNEWAHVMSIPHVAIPIIEQKYGLGIGGFMKLKDEKKLRQIYNDPDLSKFKTVDKKI